MSTLIKDGRIVEDRFALARGAGSIADLPDGTAVIVPLALWIERRAALIARGEVGVLLAPADDPAAIAADVAFLPVVAVDFPQFTDGRGYSQARLLRERFAFGGELRAVGEVLRDQLYYLAQCGFDAFLIPDGKSAEDALAGLADFTDGYQGTFARTPWFRRRARALAAENGTLPGRATARDAS